MQFKVLIFLMIGCFYGIILPGCSSKRVTVTGIAKNEPTNAFLMTISGEYYFLKGVPRWDEKYLNKMVRVSGVMQVIRYDTITLYTSKGKGETAIRGRFSVLKPKWELVQPK